MSYRPNRARLALLLTGSALALGAGPAMAATTIGQITPPGSKNPGGCSNCAELQLATAAGSPSYVVPAGGGVITSWSMNGMDGGPARLEVFRSGPGAGEFALAAETDMHQFAAGEIPTIPVRIPVAGGEHLGLGTGIQGPAWVRYSNTLADQVGGFPFAAAIGDAKVPTTFSGYLMNVAATVEPDADHDGFGDETQDGCPTDASKQGPCVPSPPPSTPAGTTAATIKLVAPHRESIKRGYLTLSAISSGDVAVSASGKVGARGLHSAGATLLAGKQTTLKLKIPKGTLRVLRHKLAKHHKLSAILTVSSHGADGATSAKSLRIRLAR
jgi:hypothetical protein